jgi:two-component system, OmpR family, sensor kinase
LYNAENKTIISVLILYLTSTILLISVLAYGYYSHEKEKLQIEEKNLLLNYAKEVYINLENIHNNLLEKSPYPKSSNYNFAIYDIDKNLLYSTLLNKDIDFSKNFYYISDYSYFIHEMSPYYMGAAYIVIEIKDHFVLKNVGKNVIALTLFIILIIILTSLFLVKLILKPIRDNLKLLDRFIKDTTHELNTPISTILTNVELLNSKNIDEKLVNKINRIKTASMTILNIYDDLVFVVLNHKLSSDNVNVNINEIMKQRVEYFNTLFKSKNISVFIQEIENSNLFIDKNKIIRLIDNLISNAIKYTNRSTHIKINIDKNSFQIIDEGKGMTKEQISTIFQRYTRFDDTQGGFGLGYNIIYSIAKEYHLKIKINSKINEGTCVKISW